LIAISIIAFPEFIAIDLVSWVMAVCVFISVIESAIKSAQKV